MNRATLWAIVPLLWWQTASADPALWKAEWPHTDFSKAAVAYDEILSGGPPKDGIPSIDQPRFVPVEDAEDLQPTEPVIGLVVDDDARAYPLRILIWHEIVNDVVGGIPVAVTYCPLCNTAIVFDRRVDGEAVEFGTTGKLRKSDLVMYDRRTESWWQQFSGEAIVGELTGTTLEMLPARLESFEAFRSRTSDGKVLVPNDPALRPYGQNPYVGYDSAASPFLFRGALPRNVPPMMRVVVLDDEAWTLPLVRRKQRIDTGRHVIEWSAGQASALDAANVAEGTDVGNVVVRRRADGRLEDVPYHLTFAFVFFAFAPDGVLHTEDGTVRENSGR